MGCGCGGGRSFAGRSASRGSGGGGGRMATPVSFNDRTLSANAPRQHAPQQAPQHVVQSASLAQRRLQTRRMV